MERLQVSPLLFEPSIRLLKPCDRYALYKRESTPARVDQTFFVLIVVLFGLVIYL